MRFENNEILFRCYFSGYCLYQIEFSIIVWKHLRKTQYVTYTWFWSSLFLESCSIYILYFTSP